MTNWKNIHPDFTEELQKDWENRGFDYWDCKWWIKVGGQPQELDLADYLYECEKYGLDIDIEIARIEYPRWKSLDFTLKDIRSWKNSGFTAEQTAQWIKVGLQIQEHDLAEQWKNCGFTPEQTTAWLASGLTLPDSAYCAWLKNSKQLTPEQLLNQGKEPQLREEYSQDSAKNKQWLDQNYPDKKVSEIYLNQQLVGELDLRGYDNLRKMSLSSRIGKSQLEIKNASYKDYLGETKKTEIIQCVPAPTCFYQLYPTKEEREQVTRLTISNQNLEGELDLSEFRNLKELDCWNNKLISFQLSNCPKLKKIHCSNNQLTNLDLSNLNQLERLDCSNNYLKQIIYPSNPEQLTELHTSNNNLSEPDLTRFSQFQNLERLRISNENKNKISQGIYNLFAGSLAPLQDLSKLKYLNISNTDINNGVEYLPESLEKIYYDIQVRPACQLKEIKEQLDLFTNEERQKKWKELGFTRREFISWTNISLKLNEHNLANYLKNGKNLTPQAAKNNLIKLKKEYHQAQNWVDYNYLPEQRVNIKELNISNQNLGGDLDLQGFPNLEKLDCSNNELTNPDLSNNLELNQLLCSNNQLTALDLSKNADLVNFDCSNNKFTNLDLSQNPKLIQVECENNPELVSLKGSESLKRFTFRKGKIKELDLSQCKDLAELDFSNNSLVNLDLSNCPKLQKLNCSNNLLTTLNLTNNLELMELLCSNKKPNHKKLTEIIFAPDFESFKLERIDISGNDQLDYVAIDKRFLKRLPNKLDYQMPALDSQKFAQIVRKRVIVPGKVTENLEELKTEMERERIRKKELEESLRNIKKETEKINKESPNLVEKQNDSNEHISCQVCHQKIEPKGNYWYNKAESNNEKFCSNKCFQEFKRIKVKSKKKEHRQKLGELEKTEEQIGELEKKVKDKEESRDITGIYPFATWWTPNCALVVNKVVWYAIRLVIYDMPETFKVIKVSEHIYQDKVKEKVQELQIQLNSDSPILALCSHNFSPGEVIVRTVLPEWAEREPDKYLRPTDLIWRTMNLPGCYHVAIYLGNKRVAHIGSSKFIKTSKINAKSNKALLGARNDHWLDFLKDAKELIRYRPIIPFKRPEKIREHISQAILAEYGAQNYSFLGNNCEHFATLCVCGVPFSTQADKIGLLAHKVHWDLAQEITETNQKFTEMPNSKAFKENTRKLKLKEIKDLKTQDELTTEEQQQLTNLEIEVERLRSELTKIISEEINKLASQGKLTEPEAKELANLNQELVELAIESTISDTASTYSSTTESSLNWKQIIAKTSIPGTIKKIIPLTTKENQILVINKVVLYAVRLLEYNPVTEEVTELKKFPNITKFNGYSTLERALQKAHKILEKEENASELEQTDTTYQIEIPPKK